MFFIQDFLRRPAVAISTFCPSQTRHKTRFWELHLEKFNSSQAGNHTNIGSILRIAAIAYFYLGHCSLQGQVGSGLPIDHGNWGFAAGLLCLEPNLNVLASGNKCDMA